MKKKEINNKKFSEFFKENAELFYIIGIFMIYYNLGIEKTLNPAIESFLWLSSSALVIILLLIIMFNAILYDNFIVKILLTPIFVVLSLSFTLQFITDLFEPKNVYSRSLIRDLFTLSSNDLKLIGFILLAYALLFIILILRRKKKRKTNRRKRRK